MLCSDIIRAEAPAMPSRDMMVRAEVSVKFHEKRISIETEIADMISGLQPLENVDTTSSKGSFSFESQEREDKESHLPPPKPYYKRLSHSQTSDKHKNQRSLVRAHSSENLIKEAPCMLRSKAMTQSMPNLQSSRSHYNRVIGNSLNSSSSTLDSTWDRKAEFEELLDNL